MAHDSSPDTSEYAHERGYPLGQDAAPPLTSAPAMVAARAETTMAGDRADHGPLEDEFVASEGLFRAIVEQAAAGVSLATLDGRFVYSNQQYSTLSGYSLDELVGMSFRDLTHPDDLAGDEPLLAALLAGEIPDYTREKRHLSKDGTVRWVSMNVSLIRAGEGRVEYLLAVVRDVSARVALEQAVAGHAAQLDAIFGAVADIVVVYDREGHLLRANPAIERVLRLDSVPEYMRLSLAERASMIQMRDISGRPMAPEELPSQRVMRGEVLEGAAAADLLLNTLDGRDVVLNWSGAPIFDAEGRAVGAVCIFRDVTERRALERRTRQALSALLAMAEVLVQPAGAPDEAAPKAEDAMLQRLAELTQSVLGGERVSIVTVDATTGLLHARAIVGLAPPGQSDWRARIEGTAPEAHVSSDGLRRLLAGEALVEGPVQASDRARRRARPGQTLLDVPMRLGDTTIGALSIDFGEGRTLQAEDMEVALAVGRLAALMIDRAQLLREREAARANALAWQEASRRMDEFIGLASHELRTPLTTIKANLQLANRRLRRMSAGNAPRGEPLADQIVGLRAVLERTLAASARQERLTRDLLDASRIHDGRTTMHLAWTDLGELVRSEIADLRLGQPERALRVSVPDQPVYVMADRDRIAQVLDNFVGNALKYSRDDQPVDVRVEMHDSAARVEVRDEGPGIAPDEQRRIWDRFYRTPGTEHVSGSELGLGLGLYISREIVARHGGQVGVASAPEGGAIFWFTLPLGAHSPTA
ncbi:MAG TPA: PAS domain S-box protein [Ktedonobacterales bacterium]